MNPIVLFNFLKGKDSWFALGVFFFVKGTAKIQLVNFPIEEVIVFFLWLLC